MGPQLLRWQCPTAGHGGAGSMDYKMFPLTKVSRKPCAGNKVKEASNHHPVSLNLRAGCRHIGGCLREQHYMPALLSYSSQAYTFSRQVAYMGLWLNLVWPLTLPGGHASCGKVCWAAPWCSMSLSSAAHHLADPCVPCMLGFHLKDLSFGEAYHAGPHPSSMLQGHREGLSRNGSVKHTPKKL